LPVSTPTEAASGISSDKTVVVIDDDEIIRLSCQQILQKAGYRVETFATGHEGIRRIEQIRPPILVVDIKMPELDGFQVIGIVRGIDADLVIVVITGYATIEAAVDAMKAGAYDFLPKPFTPSELRLIIDRAYERWTLTKEAQRLRREKKEAERKFVTLVSHQLKGPLVAVKQYLDVLLHSFRSELSERGIEWITRSQMRLGEMLTIIHDWLALARIDRGSICEREASCDLAKIAADIVRDVQYSPDPAKPAFRLELPGGLPPVRGDGVSLSMLVSNLVGNAVKYNRGGGSVRVRVSFADNFLTLEVADTGIGIPEEALPRLFQEFYRVKTAETADIPGTGLGLVICKRIVSELGGEIRVESTLGEGTRFTVRLPAAGEAVARPVS